MEEANIWAETAKKKRETEILAAELGKPRKGEDAGGNGVKKELGGKGKKASKR